MPQALFALESGNVFDDMSALASSDSPIWPAQTLASYVPRHQLRWMVEGLRPRPEPFGEEKAGVVLMVDVSGFTALTERFAAQGAVGAEQLSGILNRYFGRVTDLISAEGGDVIAFAGDSALAIWTGEDSDLAANVLHAAQAALHIQTELDRYEAAPGVALRQRAGIGCGVLRLMELGGVAGRWQFVVTGAPIREASVANHEAQAGEVVLSAGAAGVAAGRVAGSDIPSGLLKIDKVSESGAQVFPSAAFSIGDATVEALRSLDNYVPLVVSDRLRAGQGAWIAEFRTLSMVFLNLADDDGVVTALDERLRIIQEILQRYEGTLYQFLMDDKGLTAVCAFGLPPLAHEDDPPRALEAALTMREELERTGVPAAAGIATGTVFCGVYGNDERRQYTTLGNTINLAARLMQAADSGMLCDQATYRASQSASSVHFDAKGELTVKGRSAPVTVFRASRRSDGLAAAAATGTATVSIVGREAEREAFTQAIDNLVERGGSGRIVLEGEAGIGKSRLLEEFGQRVIEVQKQGRDVPCWRAAGDSIQRSTPYLAWRSVFREALQLGGVPENARRERVLAQLTGHSELLPLAPLLNPLLGLDIPQTALTAAMEGAALAENTQHLLVSLLQSAAPSGLVLLLEDAHWFDSASWRLALLVSRQIKRLLLVLATRPLAEPPAEFTALLAMSSTRRLPLAPLETDLALKLVCLRLGVKRLPPEVARFIAERGNGHPLFSEQLAFALRDAGLIQIVGTQCQVPESATGAGFDAALAALRFPSTVEGVITSRLDRLPAEVQLTVKVASVVGQNFSGSAVREIYPVAAEREQIGHHLEQAEKLALIQRTANEDGYIFQQALTQEVAYNSVPFAQRRQLHRAIGEWLERGSDVQDRYPLLAHHWRLAEDSGKAIHYCSEAGSQALRNHANQEAVRFLTDALQLEEKQGSDGQRSAEWELQLGKAYVNWSKYIEARVHLERGLKLHGQKVPAGNGGTAGALLAQVVRQCLHRGMPARFVGQRGGERESLLKFSRTYEALTEIYFLQDMSLHCLLAVFRSLNLAELAGSSSELARGYSSAGSLVGFMTLHKAANAYFELAEKISEQIKDPASRAWVSLARAMYLAGIGKWELASQLLTEAMTINDGLGDHRRGDDARIVLGIVQHLQGNFAQSMEMAEALYKSAGERLDARCQAEALRIKAYNLVVMNRMTELAAYVDELDSLRTAQVKFGGTHKKQDVHALHGLLQITAGNRQKAREAADASAKALAATSNNFFDYLLERAAVAEVYLKLLEGDDSADLRTSAQRAVKALQSFSRVFPIGRPMMEIHAGKLRLQEGKREQAMAAWQRALHCAGDLQAQYYQGLAHAALARGSSDSAAKEAHLMQARELLGRVNAVRDLSQIENC